MFRKRIVVVAATLMLGVTSAGAQGTSTTTTKSKTTTNTTSKSWKSPDGNQGGSSTTTTTSTHSKSTTVGRPSPTSNAGPGRGLPNPGAAPGVQWMAGAWHASDKGGRNCSVTLYANMSSGGGATSTGCQSDIKGIGNWAMTGNTLTLIKNLFSTAATLRQTGPSRFDGHTASGEPIAIWR